MIADRETRVAISGIHGRLQTLERVAGLASGETRFVRWSDLIGVPALEPSIAAGTTAQYWRGDKTWQTLNQAAVAGLTTSDSPTFAGVVMPGQLGVGITTGLTGQATIVPTVLSRHGLFIAQPSSYTGNAIRVENSSATDNFVVDANGSCTTRGYVYTRSYLRTDSAIVYLGSPSVDNSWRVQAPSTDLQMQRREGGTYLSKVVITPLGGIAIPLVNKTGATSVKGTIVEASATTDNAFTTAVVSSDHPFGVVYEAGVADGSTCLVIISGVAEVLLENSTASTRGNWVQTSATTAGRADMTNAAPVPATHWSEIGHCIESKTSGTNVLAKAVLHFN